MVVRAYVPDAGDLVWLAFDPQAGQVQRGRHPALILSPRSYNSKARRLVFEAKAPADLVTDVRERLRALLGL